MRSIVRRSILGLLLLAACATPEGGDESVSPGGTPGGSSGDPSADAEGRLAPPVWTDAFDQEAVLIADEVRVEGPVGLLHHLATVSDPEEFQRTEKTLPEGFLQEVTVRPETPGAEIRAQLDRFAIVALRKLSALERPGATSVVVIARGDAYWASGEKESATEKRGDVLRFEGRIAR